MCRRLAKDVGAVGDQPRKKVAVKSPKYYGETDGTWGTSEFLKRWKDLTSTQADGTQTLIINDLEEAYKNYKSQEAQEAMLKINKKLSGLK